MENLEQEYRHLLGSKGITYSQYLEKVGVPKKYSHLNYKIYWDQMSEWEQKLGPEVIKRYQRIVDVTQKVVSEEKFGMYFYGTNGAGKTSLAVCSLRHFLEKGKSVARATAQEIIDWYFKNYQGMRSRYTSADVLLLEEINKEVNYNSEHALKIIEKVVKSREEAGQITFFTANCDVSELEKNYTLTTYNIIKGTTVVAEFPKVDFRQLQVHAYIQKF